VKENIAVDVLEQFLCYEGATTTKERKGGRILYLTGSHLPHWNASEISVAPRELNKLLPLGLLKPLLARRLLMMRCITECGLYHRASHPGHGKVYALTSPAMCRSPMLISSSCVYLSTSNACSLCGALGELGGHGKQIGMLWTEKVPHYNSEIE